MRYKRGKHIHFKLLKSLSLIGIQYMNITDYVSRGNISKYMKNEDCKKQLKLILISKKNEALSRKI